MASYEDEDELPKEEEEEPLIRTIPGIDHLDEWQIEELERKKRLIGMLDKLGDDTTELKQYWFPNGMDGVPNLAPYQTTVKPRDKEEKEDDEKRREREMKGNLRACIIFKIYFELLWYFLKMSSFILIPLN
jgi:hypothetical protein